MKTYTTRKKIAIRAGIDFATGNNKIRKVGYKVVEFSFNEYDQLIGEKEVKRVIY
jgi:hypothetical protein